MPDIEDRSYALGRMEGKLDLLLSMNSAWRTETAATLDRMSVETKVCSARIAVLESWKTQTTAILWAAGAIATSLWALTKLVVPYFFK